MSPFRLVAAVCFAISSLIVGPNDAQARSDAPMQVRLSGGMSFSALEYTQSLDGRAVGRSSPLSLATSIRESLRI